MISRKAIAALKYAMPHGLVQQVFRSQAARRRLTDAYNAADTSVMEKQAPYSYSGAVEFHCARGLQRDHVINGSMPESTLAYCSRSLDELIPVTHNKPIVGLHVGNFLGVSLSHFVNYVRQRNERSVVVSIDPNIQHRGVEHPQKHVIAILNHFGLQKNATVCVGYSMNKTLSNDGVAFVDDSGIEYDPYSKFESEQSCEGVLSNLCVVSGGRFDFAVVDGNHEGSYLRRETALLQPLLRPDGILILDDVSDAWSEIKAEYEELRSNDGWRAVGADGRVGILQRGTA